MFFCLPDLLLFSLQLLLLLALFFLLFFSSFLFFFFFPSFLLQFLLLLLLGNLTLRSPLPLLFCFPLPFLFILLFSLNQRSFHRVELLFLLSFFVILLPTRLLCNLLFFFLCRSSSEDLSRDRSCFP